MVQGLLDKITLGRVFKKGLVVFHRWDDRKLIVLGDYRRKGFGGTDRLSMAVQPEAVQFLEGLEPGWTVLFEGDRLFNLSFLEECKGFCEVIPWVLTASDGVKHQRHLDREDTQDDKWLRGRATKVLRVAERVKAESKLHETTKHTRKLVKELLSLIGDCE